MFNLYRPIGQVMTDEVFLLVMKLMDSLGSIPILKATEYKHNFGRLCRINNCVHMIIQSF